MNYDNKNFPKPTPAQAFTPLIALVVIVMTTYLGFGVDAHIPLFFSVAVAALVAIFWMGHKWSTVQEGMLKGINFALDAVLILTIVGILIGAWIEGGIVPTVVYYGLQLISPQLFLVATLIVCSLVSVFTGSSWNSLGTVGLAMFVIGEGMGVPSGMTVGAIVSGAYFGDKLSPLSDTTVVASGTGGVNIYDHIKHMLKVSGPAYLIALVLFGILGSQFAGANMDYDQIAEINSAITSTFTVNPLMLVPMILVLAMIIKRVPPIAALSVGAIIGGVWALLFQGADLGSVITSMHYGFTMDTGMAIVDGVLSRGGLQSMMWTISMILITLMFGGIIEHTRMTEVMLENLLSLAKTPKALAITAHFTTLFLIMTVLSHYLTHTLICRTFKHAFEENGLHAKNVTRISENWGTLPSSLIPWGPCGVFVYGLYGVHPFTYAPYAFFILAAMAISLIFAIVGFDMAKYEGKPTEDVA
ncbi:Na+:H+ antiporter, NhaC family [Tindallia magadiensis]|uniref:Na+:H+ antiporter, NhaC family n=1 Tax=Tindallia magadiensis TaxID=69895 RepID=A0A1I3B215_9FIRM|nr:Na+/H+ antiporter NhaC [Tindallia magadiensis]SFH56242.1 Na+:H+ antiporter, NhaC family [Tindallia magadiensis]